MTATVEICTSWPMTTVPVRASMTTRAAVSGSTSSSPISAMNRGDADLRRAQQFDRAAVALEGDLLAKPVAREYALMASMIRIAVA